MIIWLASKTPGIYLANPKTKRLLGNSCCGYSPTPASSPSLKSLPPAGKQAGRARPQLHSSLCYLYITCLKVHWVLADCMSPQGPKGHPTGLKNLIGFLWGPTTLGRIAKHLDKPDPTTEMKYFLWQNGLNNWLIDGLTDDVNISLSTTYVLSLQIPRITGVDNIIIPVLQVRKLKLKKIQQHIPIT